MRKPQITLMALIFLIPLTSSAWAEKYLIDFKEKCTTIGEKLEFECGPAPDPQFLILKEGSTWIAKTFDDGVTRAVFEVLRNDPLILILEQETVYSGNQTVHIMKQNNRFYLIQVAFSSLLENNESTVKQGVYIKLED